MRILALDSSGLVASVAVAEDDTLLENIRSITKKHIHRHCFRWWIPWCRCWNWI